MNKLFALLLISPIASSFDGCLRFPESSIFNQRIDAMPIHRYSENWLLNAGKLTPIHPDFTMPVNRGGKGLKFGKITFDVPEESDLSDYPVNLWLAIEAGSDHHVLTVDERSCTIYEMFDVKPYRRAYSGAIFSAKTNDLRPGGWTSADAAGLSIAALLVKPSDFPVIKHALRITFEKTSGYMWPARHYTDGTGVVIKDRPPLGALVRLKKSFDVKMFSPANQAILNALKYYGAYVADNGGDWYVTGEQSNYFDNADLDKLKTVNGSWFDFIDVSCMQKYPNSGEIKACSTNPPGVC